MMTAPNPPHVVVVAGPNGAGKSTAAPFLLRDRLRVAEFVNADTIASGLSAFQPESVAVRAGRIMMERLRQLAAERVDFAFETTLASRSFAPWLAEIKQQGYQLHVLFLWLASADLALSRVADRRRLGGHSVPESTVRRRYDRGLRNFLNLYMPLADSWHLFDNTSRTGPRLIAAGAGQTATLVSDGPLWSRLLETYFD
jgi:predicted ABC-type ATPase